MFTFPVSLFNATQVINSDGIEYPFINDGNYRGILYNLGYDGSTYTNKYGVDFNFNRRYVSNNNLDTNINMIYVSDRSTAFSFPSIESDTSNYHVFEFLGGKTVKPEKLAIYVSSTNLAIKTLSVWGALGYTWDTKTLLGTTNITNSNSGSWVVFDVSSSDFYSHIFLSQNQSPEITSTEIEIFGRLKLS